MEVVTNDNIVVTTDSTKRHNQDIGDYLMGLLLVSREMLMTVYRVYMTPNLCVQMCCFVWYDIVLHIYISYVFKSVTARYRKQFGCDQVNT